MPVPSPTPGLPPSPPTPEGTRSSPQPTPSPTHNPPPHPVPPWGDPPDLQVSPQWLESRAKDCDAACEVLWRLLGPAKEAFDALGRAAPGWSFVDSIDDMEGRWEKLNGLVRQRLGTAADNFRMSAGEFNRIEHDREREFRQVRD